MIVVSILLVFVYLLVSLLISAGICKDKKIYNFKSYNSDSSFPNITSSDDKFMFFTIFIFWPILVIFYYIPKLIYIIFKFLINYLGWVIAKIFKL